MHSLADTFADINERGPNTPGRIGAQNRWERSGGRGTRTPKRLPAPHFECGRHLCEIGVTANPATCFGNRTAAAHPRQPTATSHSVLTFLLTVLPSRGARTLNGDAL